jgi:hypothetical protein
MRCVSCGEEMRLLQVAEDKTKMVTGYEQHTFECSGCREVEQRLVFNTGRKGPIRRNVQIVRHAKYEGSYSAQDTKSGMVVMFHKDRDRLRELSEWMGWRVVDGAASNSPDRVATEVGNDQSLDGELAQHPAVADEVIE